MKCVVSCLVRHPLDSGSDAREGEMRRLQETTMPVFDEAVCIRSQQEREVQDDAWAILAAARFDKIQGGVLFLCR